MRRPQRLTERMDGKSMEKRLNEILTRQFGKKLGTADDAQIYAALAALVREELEKRPRIEGSKKLYYVSAEFLMGKLLSNNLIALGLFDEAKTVLARYGVALSRIEEQEREPSLGNGGLGRLAACFLDSIAALGLCVCDILLSRCADKMSSKN